MFKVIVKCLNCSKEWEETSGAMGLNRTPKCTSCYALAVFIGKVK